MTLGLMWKIVVLCAPLMCTAQGATKFNTKAMCDKAAKEINASDFLGFNVHTYCKSNTIIP